MRHRVRVEDPHPKSMAAGVLLTRQLQADERARWVAFRAAYLEKVRFEHGELWCHYCGRTGLVTEVEDDATKAEMKRLATLDHVVPRSLGGDEYDEANIVVACFSCNQKKANLQWVPFWFEGNLWFGMVDGPKEWAELIRTYVDDRVGVGRLMEAQECEREPDPIHPPMPPKFGFASECRGHRTLGQFFAENGMPGVVMVQDERVETGS